MDPLGTINEWLAWNKAENDAFASSGRLFAQTQSEIWDAITPDLIPTYSDLKAYAADFMSKPHFIPTSFDTTSKLTEVAHSVLPLYSAAEVSSETVLSLFDNQPGIRDPEHIRGAFIGDVLPPIPVRLPRFRARTNVAKTKASAVPETRVVEGSIRYLDDPPKARTARSYMERTPFSRSPYRDVVAHPAPSGTKVLPSPGRIVVPAAGNLAPISNAQGSLVLVPGSGFQSIVSPSPDSTIRHEPSGDLPSGESSSGFGGFSRDGFGGGASRWNCEQVIIRAMNQPNPAEYIMHFHPECMQEFIAYLAKGY